MEEMMIKKVPVELLLTALTELYENGIIYINMTVSKGADQDSIMISEDVEDNKPNSEIDVEGLI